MKVGGTKITYTPMKNIRQIFKTNPKLLQNPQVMELIEYAEELEGIVMENNISNKYDKKDILLGIIRDIYFSCKDAINQNELYKRFPKEVDPINHEESIGNLKKYIEKICRDSNINIH